MERYEERDEVFKNGVKWIPGHDSNFNFWYDCWLDLGPIRNTIQGPFPRESNELKIKYMCSTSGWNWPLIPFELPAEIKVFI